MANLISKVLNGTMKTDIDITGQPPLNPNDYVHCLNNRFSGSNGEFYMRRVTLAGNIEKENPLLPEGENKTIGAFEYQKRNSLFIFNYNSNDDHCIFLYKKTENQWVLLGKTADFEFSADRPITGADLVNDRFLYWVDGREDSKGNLSGSAPKMIDVLKADNTNKKIYFNIYFDNDFVTPGKSYNLTGVSVNSDGDAVETETFGVTIGTGTMAEELQNITDLLNDAFTNTTFEYKEGYIQATNEFVGSSDFALVGTESIVIFPFFSYINILSVAQNAYTALNKDLLERIKYPALCEPDVSYGYDAEFGQNLITKKYFQFAAQYIYDNGKKAVAGPYSELIYPVMPCGVEEDAVDMNYILIDFTDDRLNDRHILAELKKVRLYVREGYLKPWKRIKELERQDFGIGANYYKFYNDGSYPVAETDIYTLQDEIPEIALGQTFSNSVGYLGGVLTGKDNIAIDAGVTFGYAEQPCSPPETGTVTGKIFIRNQFSDAGSPAYWFQPIHDFGSGPCFGGMGTGADIFSDTVLTNYNQKIPLRGFIVYLAGTDYYAKSVQNAPDGVTLAGGEGNVYSSSTISKRNAIRDAMEASEVYSTFTIEAPPGEYIMRVASHLLAEDETGYYKFPGSRYQDTSTYVRRMIGSPLGKEYKVTITEGGTVVMDMEIDDLVDVDNLQETNAVCGYLIDADGETDQDILVGGNRMEKQIVTGQGPGFAVIMETDHNGFFYGAVSGSIGITSNYKFQCIAANGIEIKKDTDDFYKGDLNDLLAEAATFTGGSYLVDNTLRQFILYNRSDNVGVGAKVFGRVLNGINPAPGITVNCTRTNRRAITDGGGYFKILLFTEAGNLADATVIVNHTSTCCVTYPEGQHKDFTIPHFFEDLPFSKIVDYQILPITINISGYNNELRFKKRNNVALYIQYSDIEGRRTAAMKMGEVYIPFVTEEGGSEEKALVYWSLNHKPPLDAVKAQILRPFNNFYNRYLQFIVYDAQYVKYLDTTVDPPALVLTTFDGGDATEVYLSLLTTVQYAQENRGSIVSYIPETGDRVTIFRDDEGNLLTGHYDFELRGFTGEPGSGLDPMQLVIKFDTAVPEIKPGFLIEVYTPKRQDEQPFQFEFGECIEILDPGTENRRHGKGYGGVDQIIGVQPATGQLTSGDCFYRERNMVIQSAGSKTYYPRFIEDEYIYDTDPESRQQSVGRPNYEDKEYKKQFFHTRVCFDRGFYADGDRIYNGHGNMRIGDFIDLDRKFGTLIRLLRIGNKTEIVAIHKFKVQPLYTHRVPVASISDGQFLTKDDTTPLIIGDPFENDWGSQHPESIGQEGNMFWAFDLYNGVFWYSNSGPQIPISDIYGLKKDVIAIRDAIMSVGADDSRIYTVKDRKNEEILWAFAGISSVADLETGLGGGGGGIDPGDEDHDDTGGVQGRIGGNITDLQTTFDPLMLSFSLTRKGWESYYTIYPEYMVALGKEDLFMSLAGKLWHQEKNPTALNFFGVQYTASVTFAITENQKNQMHFLYMRILSNKPWKITIDISPTASYPEGMNSRITINNFILNEGAWWADFFRDMNDPSISEPLEALFSGRELIGFNAKITAEVNNTKIVHVSEFGVGVNLSPENI